MPKLLDHNGPFHNSTFPGIKETVCRQVDMSLPYDIQKIVASGLCIQYSQIDRFEYGKRYNIIFDKHYTKATELLQHLILYGPRLLLHLKDKSVTQFSVEKINDKHLRIRLHNGPCYIAFVHINGQLIVFDQ